MAVDTATLLTRPAVELAAMIRRGEITARALTEATLGMIEARRDLNAFTYVDAEAALAAADAIGPDDPRPFAGVPIAIKELHAAVGQPLTMASDIYGDYRAPYDAYAVRRLRDAGFVFVGRTNAPELGIVCTTESRRFGPARNPWNPKHTTGGSSGGAAAAVAAGILPVAHASDGGGSIRIPAACCGLVGLKASRGRISSGPDAGDNFFSTQGALTRTIADCAALLDVMAGYEVGDTTWAPPPAEPYAVAAARPPQTLRVAVTSVSPLGTPVDPVCAQAALDAGKLLASLGHNVEELTPPVWQANALEPAFTALWGAGVATGVRYGASLTGRAPDPALVEPLTWSFYEQGMAKSAAELLEALAQLQAFARNFVAFFSTYDILLTPMLAHRPVPLGMINTSGPDPRAEFLKVEVFTPFSALANVTGQPAISLPLYQGADGLPMGVQLIAGPLREDLLLALGAQLEQALPWAGRTPPRA
jgi:amidase